ncbi:hypothetical protein Tco_1568116 [Tanacetum coccineum]
MHRGGEFRRIGLYITSSFLNPIPISIGESFYISILESKENVDSIILCQCRYAVRPHQFHKKEDSPAIVLDETYANKTDYSLALLGKVKDFTSLTNLNVVLANEGFVNVKLKYMGGFWVMIVFTSEGAKETFRSKVGIGSWFAQLLQASNSSSLMKEVTMD